MIGFSSSGHSVATVKTMVAAPIITSVAAAGLRRVRRLCQAIHPHAPKTERRDFETAVAEHSFLHK